MLEVMKDYFKLSDARMHLEIRAMQAEAIQALQRKCIDYAALRSGLIPSTSRNEVGLIFDSRLTGSSWYGREIMKQVLPLLERKTTQSVLVGDLLGKNQQLIFEIFEETMVLAKSFAFPHSTNLFCVYINNLANGTVKRLHEELSSYPAYLGFVPATFGSRAKIYLSTCLTNVFLKHGHIIIVGHEDDRDDADDVNMPGYAFEDFGYTIRSVAGTQFGVFLSYKIERPVLMGFESDSQMAINAISPDVFSLQHFEVQIDPRRYQYLTTEKLGKLTKAGIAELDRDRLSSLIKAKLAASYIYNMDYLEEHGVMKFNVMIEVERPDGGYPTRLIAAMKYLPEQKILELLTLH